MKQTNVWVETGENQKLTRKVETDVIKSFVDYAINQGSSNANRYYSKLTKMENNALFIIKDKFPNIKDVLTPIQLMNSSVCNEIVINALLEGMEKEMFYKEIYQMAKQRVEIFASVMPKTPVPMIESIEKK